MLDTGQLDVLRSPVTLELRILGPLEVSDEAGHVALGGPGNAGCLPSSSSKQVASSRRTG